VCKRILSLSQLSMCCFAYDRMSASLHRLQPEFSSTDGGFQVLQRIVQQKFIAQNTDVSPFLLSFSRTC